MMENDMVNVGVDMASRSSVVIDSIPLNTIPDSVVQSNSFDLNNQNQIMTGFPVLSTSHGEPIINVYADLHITNRFGAVDSDALVTSLGRNFVRDSSIGSSHTICNTDFHDLVMTAPSIYPSEVIRTYVSNDCSNTSNSSFVTSVSCGYNEVLCNMNSKWDFNKFSAPPGLDGKSPVSSGFQPFSSIGNLDPNGWLSSNDANMSMGHPYPSSKLSNELSLSLATSRPCVISGTNIPDQCSVTHLCINETGLGSEQTSCNSKELSLSFGSYREPQFSQVAGSRYLHVIRDILAQIANYSLENLDQTSYSTDRIGAGVNIPFSSSCPSERGVLLMCSDELPDVNGRCEVQMEPALRRQEIEARKTQLLTLLQVVDDRYNQCLDEIHTVTSAFHAATEFDPQIHARFSLQTISFLYKNLRERISNQILAMGAHFDREKEKSFENSFIQKQWALQQLKRKDHQLWRPQRGLPERSVSVLRAWMFQNFLHPYPKDAEKQLLAIKSGLTRNQVSNWFINARVRLWKPMIEEMYSEMNKRKARQNEEGTDSNHRSHISINCQRFNMN